MKTLSFNQIEYSDSFIEENLDLLPNIFVWFYDIITNTNVVYRNNVAAYPSFSLLFNQNGEQIFSFHRRTGYLYLNGLYYNMIYRSFLSIGDILCIQKLIEYKFNIKIINMSRSGITNDIHEQIFKAMMTSQ